MGVHVHIRVYQTKPGHLFFVHCTHVIRWCISSWAVRRLRSANDRDSEAYIRYYTPIIVLNLVLYFVM